MEIIFKLDGEPEDRTAAASASKHADAITGAGLVIAALRLFGG